MPSFALNFIAIFFGVFLLGHAGNSSADLVRSASLIESIPAQGVTLAMTPEQAFEALILRGYNAGEIVSFDQWRSGSIEFVKGGPQDASGESWISLGRQRGRLINISEMSNRPPGGRFDYESEIARVKEHFAVSDEEQGCGVNTRRGAGACSVNDGDQQKPLIFNIQVNIVTRMIQLGYMFEPTVGPDDPDPT